MVHPATNALGQTNSRLVKKKRRTDCLQSRAMDPEARWNRPINPARPLPPHSANQSRSLDSPAHTRHAPPDKQPPSLMISCLDLVSLPSPRPILGDSPRLRASAPEARARRRALGSSSRHGATAASRGSCQHPENAGAVCPARPPSQQSSVTAAEAARHPDGGGSKGKASRLFLTSLTNRRGRGQQVQGGAGGVPRTARRHGHGHGSSTGGTRPPSPAIGTRSPRHGSGARHSEGKVER